MVEVVRVVMSHNDVVLSKQDFAIKLQIKAWKQLFSKLNMAKYVTSQVMKDINAFCERQHNVPFTVRNIRRMFEILVGTQDQIFERSLVEAIDNFTRYTHENRYALPGWKTNAGHLLNKKFIIDYIVEVHGWSAGRMSLIWNSRNDRVQDLVKVTCRLTGRNYDDIPTLYALFIDDENPISRGVWYDWGFFQFKCFKKGTMHVKFKDLSVWEMVNKKYAEIKGQVLPEKIQLGLSDQDFLVYTTVYLSLGKNQP